MRRSVLILVCSVVIASAVMQSGCAHEASAINDNSPASAASSTARANSNNSAPASPPPLVLLKPAAPADPSFKACNTYYPLVPGSQLAYVVKKPTGPVGTVTVAVSAADEKGKKVFTEVAKSLTTKGVGAGLQTTTRKYVCDGENIQVVSNVIEVTNPMGSTGRMDGKLSSASLVMMPPSALTLGASWSYSMDNSVKLPDKPEPQHSTMQFGFEVKGPEDVSVPAGTFHTIRIAAKVNGQSVDEYYAPGIGLVRRASTDGTTWELSEYTGLTPPNK
jgi:hypothetical protein